MLTWVENAPMVVDDSYQRAMGSLAWRHIIAIADNFDWSKFTPVIVAPVEGGFYAIIDGQHRPRPPSYTTSRKCLAASYRRTGPSRRRRSRRSTPRSRGFTRTTSSMPSYRPEVPSRSEWRRCRARGREDPAQQALEEGLAAERHQCCVLVESCHHDYGEKSRSRRSSA